MEKNMKEKDLEKLLMLMATGTIIKSMTAFPAWATKEVLEECTNEFWARLSYGKIVEELAIITTDFLLEYQIEIDKFVKKYPEVFEKFMNGSDAFFNFVPENDTTQ
jgi:hypothetical protein